MFHEKKLTVPAGTLAIVHHDMFHRATRHTEEAKWRPMIKMGAVRLVEPELSSPVTTTLPDDSVAFTGPGSSLWSEVWGVRPLPILPVLVMCRYHLTGCL